MKILSGNFFSISYLKKNSSSDSAFALFKKLGYGREDALKLISAPVVKKNLDGSTEMPDDSDPLICIKNNRRMTAYQPEHFKNKKACS